MEMDIEQMITEDDELIVSMSVEYRDDITVDDFKKLCRLCGNCSNQLMPIFTEDGLEHNLPGMIKDYLPIDVSFEDDLPSNICYQCASTLISWHELYYACKEANQRLRELSSRLLKPERNADNLEEKFENNSDSGEDVTDTVFLSNDVPSENEADVSKKTELAESTNNEPTQLSDINDRCTSLNSNVVSASPTEFRIIVPQASSTLECNLDIEDDRTRTVNSENGSLVTNSIHLLTDSLPSSGNEDSSQTLHASGIDSTVEKETYIAPSVEVKSEPKAKTCDTCGRQFLNSVNLVVHMNELRIIQANLRFFQSNVSKKTMVETLILEDLFECGDCQRKFRTKSSLRAHIRKEHLHVKKFECDICHWRYQTECDLATHRSVHSLNEKLICRFCGGRYRFSVRRHYESTSKLVTCTCAFKINSSAQQTETNLSLIKSKLRPSARLSVTKSVPSLAVRDSNKRKSKKWWDNDAVESLPCVRRMQNVHATKCESCNMECGSYYALKKHKRTHSERVFCDICGKKYLKHYLKTHMLIHSSEKTFACDKCGKAFAQKSSLRAHQMLEDNVKKFMCNICGMQFVLSSRMQWHMKTHMDAKPFKCVDCDKEYGYLWQLNQHRVAHSNERKFVCEYCAKSYKTMKHLRQHWHHYPCHRQ